MAAVAIFERTEGEIARQLKARGHHVVYRTNESNRCPGCGRSQWYVGRITAECGFCGTAVPLAEVKVSATGATKPAPTTGKRKRRRRGNAADAADDWEERRQHERIRSRGRTLQLMVDGSPHSFALENLSAGGVMGRNPAGVAVGTRLHVRFEGGILVPAEVKWTEGDLVGLAFTSPLILDLPAKT
jgi:hypothetical protein